MYNWTDYDWTDYDWTDYTLNVPHLLLWIEDLETTTDPQTRGYLTRTIKRTDPEAVNGHAIMSDFGVGDCCLGRACKVAIACGVEILCEDRDGVVSYDDMTANLPKSVLDWLGMRNIDIELLDNSDEESNYYNLIELNDERYWSFAKIGEALRLYYRKEIRRYRIEHDYEL